MITVVSLFFQLKKFKKIELYVLISKKILKTKENKNRK
jgi:hypothetical protein